MGRIIELTTAVSAMVIALASLFVAQYQIDALDKHNRVSVTPNLTISTSLNSQEKTLAFTIKNNGIGPARIKKFTITYNNKVYESPKASTWKGIIKLMGDNAKAASMTTGLLSVNEVLGIEQEVVIIEFESHGKKPSLLLRDEEIRSRNPKIQESVIESTKSQKRANFTELVDTLDNLTIYVEYENFYKEPMPSISGGVLDGYSSSSN